MSAELSEEWCYEILRQARWPHGVVCPFCRRGRARTHSRFVTTPRRRYLCLACRRTFTDLTGTPLARTNLPLNVWFECLRLTTEGRSTAEVARQLGAKWETAARMQRRLAQAPGRSGLVRRLRAAVRTFAAGPEGVTEGRAGQIAPGKAS